MPIYILLSTLSQQGVQTLRSNPDRLREVNRDVEELGAKVLHQWATLGEFDFVNIVEAADEAAIARNLAKAGFRVRVWNRTHAAAEAIEGVTVADTPAEAVRGSAFILTMLPDGRVVAEVAGDALDGAGENTIWIQSSTVGVAATERLAELAARRGVAFVDAPVVETKEPAERGELTVLASSREKALAQ